MSEEYYANSDPEGGRVYGLLFLTFYLLFSFYSTFSISSFFYPPPSLFSHFFFNY